MTRIRVIEVNTYNYDTDDFEDAEYHENGAYTDREKLDLDRKDIESKKLKLTDLDPNPHRQLHWSIVID